MLFFSFSYKKKRWVIFVSNIKDTAFSLKCFKVAGVILYTHIRMHSLRYRT